MFTWITLATALTLSGIAAFYSIIGLTTIFAGAYWPIVIMGCVLEVAKVVATSWVYRNWFKTNATIKYYLTAAVCVLMLITSMGIFGFLSKAHTAQAITSGDNTLQIQQIDQKIQRQQDRISDAQLVLSQLDAAVQVLIDNNRIRGTEGSIAVRESQKVERAALTGLVDDASEQIGIFQSQKLRLNQEQLIIEAEVGPIKYIAEMFYDKSSQENLNKAVRAAIILIVIVFDPLAIALLVAANSSMPTVQRSRKVTKALTSKRKRGIIEVDKKSIVRM